jgi:hypothetical protein
MCLVEELVEGSSMISPLISVIEKDKAPMMSRPFGIQGSLSVTSIREVEEHSQVHDGGRNPIGVVGRSFVQERVDRRKRVQDQQFLACRFEIDHITCT